MANPLGLMMRTLGKSADDAAEAAAAYGAKQGSKLHRKGINYANKAARKEAIEQGYQRGLQEARQPHLAGADTDMYFMHDGVEYRRRLNPKYVEDQKVAYSTDTPMGSGRGGSKRVREKVGKSAKDQYAHNKWLYESREGTTGAYSNISGQNFGKAKQAYGGDIYASYDDMLLARHGYGIDEATHATNANVAREVAEATPEDNAGVNLWQMISDHPVIATGGLLGGGMLLGEFLEED